MDCIIKNMKKLMPFLVGIIFISYHLDSYAYINRSNAVISIMNKAAGKVQTVTIPVGQETTFEKLSLLVRDCKQTDPFEAEDFFAFIEISKYSEGKIFSGWMSHNEPGKNPLQNADYDVWLVKCE